MSDSPYEDRHGFGTGDVINTHIRPLVKCDSDDCERGVIPGQGICRECYERRERRRMFIDMQTKPILHF